MAKVVFQTVFHKVERPQRKLSSVSAVQPDQTMSLRTILDRYARGIPVDSPVGSGYYNDDPDNPSSVLPPGVNYADLDLTDKQAIREQIVEELADIADRHEKTRQKRKKDALKAELEEEVRLKIQKDGQNIEPSNVPPKVVPEN